jgi:hypothetical protein
MKIGDAVTSRLARRASGHEQMDRNGGAPVNKNAICLQVAKGDHTIVRQAVHARRSRSGFVEPVWRANDPVRRS